MFLQDGKKSSNDFIEGGRNFRLIAIVWGNNVVFLTRNRTLLINKIEREGIPGIPSQRIHQRNFKLFHRFYGTRFKLLLNNSQRTRRHMFIYIYKSMLRLTFLAKLSWSSPILSYPILSSRILSYPALFYHTLSYPSMERDRQISGERTEDDESKKVLVSLSSERDLKFQ